MHYIQFSPADFVDPNRGSALYSDIDLKIEFDTSGKKGPIAVDDSGSFQLGMTQFSQPVVTMQEEGPNLITASGQIDEQEVVVSFRIDNPQSRWHSVKLKSEGSKSAVDLWSKVLFGRPVGQLPEEQRQVAYDSVPQSSEPSEDVDEPDSSDHREN